MTGPGQITRLNWSRIEHGFLRHPDVASLTPPQQVAYLALILDTHEHNRRGEVERRDVLRLRISPRTIDALFAAHRLECHCGESRTRISCNCQRFSLRNFDKYNANLQETREKAAAKKRRQRGSATENAENVPGDTSGTDGAVSPARPLPTEQDRTDEQAGSVSQSIQRPDRPPRTTARDERATESRRRAAGVGRSSPDSDLTPLGLILGVVPQTLPTSATTAAKTTPVDASLAERLAAASEPVPEWLADDEPDTSCTTIPCRPS